ncbi:MAG: 3-deoxy-D-manno-octulosonic acid transferase [Pseudomonadota bacterium]
MSAPPFGLSLYRAATRLLAPVAPLVLDRRARHGKEDQDRLGERLARDLPARPAGPLIWLHGASVGESRITLRIGQALQTARPEANLLFTSGTLTSANMIADQKPSGSLHQFLPVDAPRTARRFAEHWSPELAVFAESELWPNLILETTRTGAAMALINARMNQKSLRGWARFPHSAAWLLGCFDWIGAADQTTATGLSALAGREIAMTGSLKLLAGEPDVGLVQAFRLGAAGRLAWVAGSTHPGEEDIVLDAFARLRAAHPDALLILAPRHPERCEAVLDQIRRSGLSARLRSRDEPPDASCAVWLIDTMGELPAAYGAAPVAFIGGSLIDGIGGHTPVEATMAGAGVISGPHAASFEDIYAAYRAHDAVTRVQDAETLAAAVEAGWAGEAADAKAGHAAIAALGGLGADAVAARLVELFDSAQSEAG